MIKILEYSKVKSEEIFSRMEDTLDVSDIVSDIIADVRKNGDEALKRYAEKFDKAVLTNIEVSEKEIEDAFASVDEKLIEVMKEAKENIYSYHKRHI